MESGLSAAFLLLDLEFPLILRRRLPRDFFERVLEVALR